MKSIERRERIKSLLIDNLKPIKGSELARIFGVTRQIIVRDIAILRANGNEIIATPDGYLVARKDERVRNVIAVKHNHSRLNEELSIIIKYGGMVEDIIVEHSLYGEIKGMLMINNLNDLERFISEYEKSNAKLLSILTDGVHLHTISTSTEENMNSIISTLREKNFLVE